MLIREGFIPSHTLESFRTFIEQVRHECANKYLIPEDRGSFLDKNGAVVILPEEPQ